MKTRRINPQRFAANYSLRNLPKSDLGGVIFGCKHNTIKECLTKQLFGLTSVHFSYIRNIEQGLPLFLFNFSDRKLHGIFEAVGPGLMYIDPYAWSENANKKTPFPAQVRICTRTRCIPIPEAQLKDIIGNNYFNEHQFWFELDREQTKHLMDIFKSSTRYANIPVPLPLPPTNKVQNNKKKLRKNQIEKYVKNASRSESENHENNNEWGNNNENYENETNNYNINNNENYNEEDSSTQFKTAHNEINWANNNNNNQVKRGDEDYNDKNNVNNSQLGFGYQDSKEDGLSTSNNPNAIDNEWSTYNNPNKKDNEWGVYNNNNNDSNKKEELKGCVTERVNLTQTNMELVQLVEQLKIKTREMEKKQVESDKEIERLNKIVINSGKTIFILENRVAELESTLQSTYNTTDNNNNNNDVSTLQSTNNTTDNNNNNNNVSTLQSTNNTTDNNNNLSTLQSTNNTTDNSSNNNNNSIQYGQAEKMIYLIGGYDGSKWLSSLESFVPLKDEINPLREMRCSRSYASVSVLGNGIFVCGGGDGSSWCDTVECYKRESDEWTLCPSLSSAKGSLAGLTLNGKIFVIGGGNDELCLSEVEMFDPVLGKWIKTHPMLQKRFAPAAAEFNGAIYAVGGYDGRVYLESAERYDPREGQWVKLASMNTPRGCSSLAAIGASLYCVGGYDGEKTVSTTEMFDPRASSWVPGRPTRYPRGYAASAVFDDTFYLFGGHTTAQKMLDKVECFNERTGWYEPGFKSVVKRCFASAVAL